MINNILVRALIAVIVAFVVLKYLLPLAMFPNPIGWILSLIVVIACLWWVFQGSI